MNHSIRELRQGENKVLNTFLYEAIFIPEKVPAPTKDIINQPELQVYVRDFGKNKGDLCLVAEVNTELIKQMLMKLKMQGYKQASLAVQKMNYAVHMYQKVGFEIVHENDEEFIMICRLQALANLQLFVILMK